MHVAIVSSTLPFAPARENLWKTAQSYDDRYRFKDSWKADINYERVWKNGQRSIDLSQWKWPLSAQRFRLRWHLRASSIFGQYGWWKSSSFTSAGGRRKGKTQAASSKTSHTFNHESSTAQALHRKALWYPPPPQRVTFHMDARGSIGKTFTHPVVSQESGALKDSNFTRCGT